MQASGRVTGCCVALVITLACASALQTLNSISDLKAVDFGHSVPKHSLLLLHWFANTVEIDNNNVIRLTFDPDSDYGSHYYGNIERMLDRPRQGYRYYTIGNLNHGATVQLPDHVIHPRRGYNGGNRDRIIISVRDQTVGRVFITQHYETWEQRGTLYDPNHTYQITTNLLRQIREFRLRDNNQPLLYLRNRYQSDADVVNLTAKWGHLACLGLFLFILIEEKYKIPRKGSNRQPPDNTPQHNNRPPHVYPTNRNDSPQFTNNRPSIASCSISSVESNRCCQNNRLKKCCLCLGLFIFACLVVISIVIYIIFKK